MAGGERRRRYKYAKTERERKMERGRRREEVRLRLEDSERWGVRDEVDINRLKVKERVV